MSILGYDNNTATLTGIADVFATNAYIENLFLGAPPVNLTTIIAGLDSDITVLEGQMVTANSNISTLQGQVSTLDGEMNTAQSDINTLQSEMNDAQADIGALYGISATNSTAIAGLSVSQASQDVIIASHTLSIAGLNSDVSDLQSDVTALEVKTTDMSWASLTRTTFSGKVNVGSTSAGVTLYTTVASEFGSGISASNTISTTGIFSSTSGTSSMSSLLVNNNFEVTNVSYFGDTLFCDRNVLTSAKKLVLYDANTGNDYDYLGFWTDSGTASKKFLNAEIDGVTGSAFQWYYGNNLGSSRTLAKSLSSAEEISFTPKATFLKSSGFSQQIQLVKDSANNKVRVDMIGDTAGLNTFDGQIIQEQGNGVDDNRGIMTIQSGDVTINALTSATTGTLQLNSKVFDVNVSGAITIDSGSTTNITSINDLTIQTTNPFGDISVISAGTNTFTSTGQTQINCSTLDINASGALTIDPLTFTMNTTALTGTAMTWQSNTTGSDLILTNPTAGAFSIESGSAQDLIFKTTGLGDLNFDSNGDAGFNIASIMNTTAGAGVNFTSTTGNVNFTASAGDVNLNGTDVVITTTGTGVGEFVVRANTNVDIKTTTGNIELNANTTMLLTSGGTQTVFVSGANKMVTTSTTTTLTNNNIAINGNTTVNPDNTFNMMPTSTIIQNVSATVPSGFLYCNGQAVSRSTYARLFASIGTTFGVGNGTTTFNVPNFLGAFLRGASTQTVGGIAYTAPAIGTAQQDMALTTPVSGYSTPFVSTGFRSCGAGTRDCLARTSQGDTPENPTGLNLAYPSGRGGTEVRPFNFSVYYYIRY